MSSYSPRTKEVISGLAAGSFSTIVSHPLDLIKVRLQLDTSTRMSHFESFQRVWKHLVTGDQSQKHYARIRSLYRGLSINVLGNAVSWSLYFALYNEFKSLLLPPTSTITTQIGDNVSSTSLPLPSVSSQYHTFMLCSFASGAITTLLTNPMWVLKTRLLSTDKDTPGAYKGIYDGVAKIMHSQRGWRVFFRGFTPGLISVSQGSLYFTIYDSLKHHHNMHNANQQYDFWMYLYISSVSKTVSTSVFYPLQLIKARLQLFGNESLSLRDVLSSTYAKEGLGGLYRGLYINLLRTLPSTCVTFLTYELMKTLL